MGHMGKAEEHQVENNAKDVKGNQSNEDLHESRFQVHFLAEEDHN